MEWRLCVRAATALVFGAAAAYGIWRLEWFDVFRWGMPSTRLLVTDGGYVSAAAMIGWVLAVLCMPRKYPT